MNLPKKVKRTSKIAAAIRTNPSQSVEQLSKEGGNAVTTHRYRDSTWLVSHRAFETYETFMIESPDASEQNDNVLFPIKEKVMVAYITQVKPRTSSSTSLFAHLLLRCC
jgi:hypothetical protein